MIINQAIAFAVDGISVCVSINNRAIAINVMDSCFTSCLVGFAVYAMYNAPVVGNVLISTFVFAKDIGCAIFKMFSNGVFGGRLRIVWTNT